MWHDSVHFMMIRLVLVLAVALALAACFGRKVVVPPAEADAYARHFLEMMHSDDYRAVWPMVDMPGDETENKAGLTALHDALAHGEMVSIEPMGWGVFMEPGARKINLNYLIRLPDQWLQGNVYLLDQGDGYRVLGTHFNMTPDSVVVKNDFTLRGKSAMHYLVFALCVAVPLFIIYALVICSRTRVRWKWLWIIFILLGVFRFQFDWTSGMLTLQPLSVLLLGASCFRPGFIGPWFLSFAIPLGAIIFLARRSKLARPPTL